MQLVVGRIARAHGTGGDVSVEVLTDTAETRFAVGSRLDTDPPERGPVTVRSTRWHQGRLLVGFEGVTDRATAETLRGTLLVADSSTSPAVDAETWWDHDLIGLRAESPAGERLGEVVDISHGRGGDLLVVRRDSGAESLVPFVAAIVPSVDVEARRVVIDPPPGLLEL